VKILITGICGFVGSSLVEAFAEAGEDHEIVGVDNLSRPGSELNRARLLERGVELHHGDIRNASTFESLPHADWVIDAAANPTVLAGTDGATSTRALVENNLYGTLEILEYCNRSRAGLILLSTSRVYSIPPLATLPMEVVDDAFRPLLAEDSPAGLGPDGVDERFSTAAPISLYGSTKLASEALALEFGEACDFPVWINRCGVMAGPRQFGRPDQGIFAYWLHAWQEGAPLRYLGFEGRGHQVRDALHPRDLASLLSAQLDETGLGELGAGGRNRLQNVSGGVPQSISLRQLSRWCEARFGPHPVIEDPAPRTYDLPWLVLSSARAESQWDWRPGTNMERILSEIADFAEATPGWLGVSSGTGSKR
jgi:CDP-paratose 2-epimerase